MADAMEQISCRTRHEMALLREHHAEEMGALHDTHQELHQKVAALSQPTTVLHPPVWAVVAHTHAQGEGLHVFEGEELTVEVGEPGGWWYAEKANGEAGWVPAESLSLDRGYEEGLGGHDIRGQGMGPEGESASVPGSAPPSDPFTSAPPSPEEAQSFQRNYQVPSTSSSTRSVGALMTRATVIRTYDKGDALTIHTGEEIEVNVGIPGEWWYARKASGDVGWVPGDFVTVEEAPMPGLVVDEGNWLEGAMEEASSIVEQAELKAKRILAAAGVDEEVQASLEEAQQRCSAAEGRIMELEAALAAGGLALPSAAALEAKQALDPVRPMEALHTPAEEETAAAVAAPGDRKAWLLHEHREAEACLEELTQRLEGAG